MELVAKTIALLAVGLSAEFVRAADRQPIAGQVTFEPAATEEALPEIFRLGAHTFPFDQRFVDTVSTEMVLSRVTFPSPVTTPHPENNTVHCEYFRPSKSGPYRGVIVLHILGGDFDLARLFCRHLAANGVAALFLKMPYYGERRPPDSKSRMVSIDPRETVAGMKQAILDIRRARAWLASREEVRPEGLGIFGISLGGITSALAASAEPRFERVCLMLAGGDIAAVGWNQPRLARIKEKWLADGGTQESYVQLLRSIDPVTYARPVAGRELLMINAKQDEIIPPVCTESLWRAFGKPPIVWYNAGHISCIRYLFDGLAKVTTFFTKP